MAVRNITRNKPQTALGEAIIELGLAAGLTEEQVAQTPKKVKRNVKRRDRSTNSGIVKRAGLGWEHDVAEVTITVAEGNCETAVSDGPNTWAKLILDRSKRHTSELNVEMNLDQLENNLLKYVVRNGDQVERVEAGKLATLTIPVTWNDQDQPQMRAKDVDNCDIILINQAGLGIQLQISVVTRWGAIYVQLQELQSLQIVTTTAARAEKYGLTSVPTGNGGAVATVIPLFGYHNRPGTDWLSVKNSAKFGAEEVVPTCLAEGRVGQLGNAFYEDWEPAELGEPTVEGKVRGVVSWYNLIFNGGFGFIEYGDGKSVSVHWTQLRDRNTHALQPMSVVEFSVGEHKGRMQAKAVCVV